MEQGDPYVRVRGESDYWLYSELFADTCPIMIEDGQVIGTLCLLDSEPVVFSERDLKLLEALAADTMQALRTSVAMWSEPALPVDEPGEVSAIVGQVRPYGR